MRFTGQGAHEEIMRTNSLGYFEFDDLVQHSCSSGGTVYWTQFNVYINDEYVDTFNFQYSETGVHKEVY